MTTTVASSFSWTIGTITGNITGASAGSGSTINQILTNPSNSDAGSVEYIVTPTSTTGGCVGAPYSIIVTLNPSPVVTTANTAEICSSTAPGITLSASTDATFSWTIGNNAGGITGATAGSGNTINQTLTNPSNSTAGSIEYIVTPKSTTGSCPGSPYTITVTVDPTPVVTIPNTAEICSGGNTNISLVSSAPSNFSWTVGTVTGGITGATSGSGPLINDVLVNPDPSIAGTVKYLVTPTSTTGSCAGRPYTITVKVDAPVIITAEPIDQVSCATFIVNFSVTATGTGLTYQWYKVGLGAVSNTSNISGAQSANLHFNQVTTDDVGDYYVIVSGTAACANPKQSATVHLTVNQQIVINSQPVSAAICTGGTAAFTIDVTATGPTYQWRLGNNPLTNRTLPDGTVISGSLTNTLSIANATPADNATNYNVIVTTPGGNCAQAFSGNVSLTVNPIPNVNAVTNKVYCNTTASGNISLTGTVGGTVFNWVNDNTAIGLAASGTGNISSFTATNSTNAPITATITVTPTYTNSGSVVETCTGTPITFIITVNPTATVNPVADQPVCNGANTTAIAFASPSSGGTIIYNWTNSASSIGLAATGNGDISSFTAINNGAAPVTATITLTPSYTNGVACGGTSTTFNIIVNPTPKLSSSLTPPAICNNSLFNYNPTSASTGVTFAWSRAAVAGISNVAASGTGNLNETLINTTANPISVVYAYTLSLTGDLCPNTQNVTVVVNPTPTLTSTLTPPNVCSNSPFTYTPTSATSPITFSWSRAAVAGISNAAASGTENTNETLVNTSGVPVNVTYKYTLTANGCSNVQNVVVKVNPTVNIAPLSQEICTEGSIVPIDNSRLPAGTITGWTRNSPAGITSTIGTSGSGPISGTFTNSNTTATLVTFTINAQAINGCTTTTTATVAVDAPLVPPTIGSSQIVCSSASAAPLSVSISASGGLSTGYTYNWIKSVSNNGPWLPIAGATGTTYTPPTSSSFYKLVVYNACGNDTSNLVQITTANDFGLTFSGNKPSSPLCSGSSFSYTEASGDLYGSFGDKYIRYSWQSQNPGYFTSTQTNPYGQTHDVSLFGFHLFYYYDGTATFTVNNPTNAPTTQNLLITPNIFNSDGSSYCNLSPDIITVAINPIVNVNNVNNQTLCKGSLTQAVNFSTTTTGGTISYTWSNDNPGIGLAATGTGNIAAFTAMNSGNTTLTSNITVTPSITYSGKTCSGTPSTFKINVNPTPVTAAPASQTICSTGTNSIGLSSNVSSSTINWTVTSQTGVTGATLGSGTSIAQTLTATGSTPGTVVYSVTSTANSCPGAATNVTVTVNPTLLAGTVSGTTPLCIGQNATFTSTGSAGGTWNSTNTAVATVNPSTGVVTALTAGNTNITYSFNTGCGAPVSASAPLTVRSNAISGTVSGSNNPICIGSTTTFSSNGTAGGTWSSNNTGVATVDDTSGVITAVTAGTATISYTVAGCNATVPATKDVTVSPDANPGSISTSGSITLCIGQTVTFSSNGDAGTWSSDKTSVAAVNASTGVVTAVSAGNAHIIYTVSSGCNSTKTVQAAVIVNPDANAGSIKGYTTPVCATSQVQLYNTGDAGGTWTSSDLTVGTVDQNGVVKGQGPGTTIITYTVSSGCNPPSTATVDVSFTNAGATLAPGPITAPTGPLCANTSGFTFSVDPVTDASFYAWTLPSRWTFTTPNPQTNTITVKTNTTSGMITVSAGNACNNNGATGPALAVVLHNVWTGTTSTDWNIGTNWADGNVPSMSCSDVYIPGGTPNQPTLGTGTAAGNNLHIATNATLAVDNATMQIAGTIDNQGHFIASNGTLEFNGSSAQNKGNMFDKNRVENLKVSNNSLTIANDATDTLKISGVVSFGHTRLN